MTIEEEILESANLTPELANKMALVSKVADGAARLWEVARPCPGNDKMQVLAMFEADDEEDVAGDYRVYVVPVAAGLPFACHTVNRIHPGFASKSINDREVFLDEIVGELSALAVSQGLLVECPHCDTPNRPPPTPKPGDKPAPWLCVDCDQSLYDDGELEEEPEETEVKEKPANGGVETLKPDAV
jgi:hypothetical protein